MTDQHRHDHNPEHDAQPYWVQYPDGTVAGPYYNAPGGQVDFWKDALPEVTSDGHFTGSYRNPGPGEQNRNSVDRLSGTGYWTNLPAPPVAYDQSQVFVPSAQLDVSQIDDRRPGAKPTPAPTPAPGPAPTYYQMPDGNIVTLASPESPSHTLGVGAEATSSSGVQATGLLAPIKVTLVGPTTASVGAGAAATAAAPKSVQASASLAPAKITQPASVKAGAGAGATGSTPNVQATASLPKASTSTPNPTPVKSGPIKQA